MRSLEGPKIWGSFLRHRLARQRLPEASARPRARQTSPKEPDLGFQTDSKASPQVLFFQRAHSEGARRAWGGSKRSHYSA